MSWTEGDWMCGACQHHNFRQRDACQLCAYPKFGGPADLRSYLDNKKSTEVLAGDWFCTTNINCGAHNYASRSNCYRCGAFKNVHVGQSMICSQSDCSYPPGWKTGDWICNKCCVNDAEFAVISKNKGLCDCCLELAWLIEAKKDVDSNGSKVDFHDRDTSEFLFYEYWEIIKEKEGLTSEQVITVYNQLKNDSDSHEHDEVKEGTSESDDESQLDIFNDDTDGCKQIGKRKRMKGQHSAMKRKVKSKRKEFIRWGSEPLLEFLASIGKDTSTEMSQYDVMDIITEYCRKNKLFDPEKSKKINFDARLQALLRRKSVNRNSLYNLLTPHLADNLELSEDELECGSKNIDKEDLAPRKRQHRLSSTEKSNTKAEVVNVQKSCFASIIPKNIKLLYLRKSLIEDLSKQLETFEDKVMGTFVRVKSDPYDYLQKNSHVLVQVTDSLQLLQKPEEQSRLLRKVPEVIADDVDVLEIANTTGIETKDAYNTSSSDSDKRVHVDGTKEIDETHITLTTTTHSLLKRSSGSCSEMENSATRQSEERRAHLEERSKCELELSESNMRRERGASGGGGGGGGGARGL
ncbi:hypothetical protein LWI29_031280 [Acer saccharum]|uniref:Uncharacterized protein n=1 Tax=Acer saccharum TaxID=4024 RepID=A0AA39RFN4_ACESA|nr:hypothetical protein LWI29_031280 [Acer saccharum]